MGLVTSGGLSRRGPNRLKHSSRLSSISDRLMASVGDIVNRDAALFITNDSAGFFCPGDFSEDQLGQIRKRLESVSRSSGREGNPPSNDSFETHHFADGSFAFLI